VVRTGSLRTQSARHTIDHGTICGRSCANSGHYKPLCARVDRTKFVAPVSVAGPNFFWKPDRGRNRRYDGRADAAKNKNAKPERLRDVFAGKMKRACRFFPYAQPQDGQGAWPRNSVIAARPRRRGDRVTLRKREVWRKQTLYMSGGSAHSHAGRPGRSAAAAGSGAGRGANRGLGVKIAARRERAAQG
jgi:hypothetical protein